MHSHDTKNATFLYNGDFSGDVIIQERDVIRKPGGLVVLRGVLMIFIAVDAMLTPPWPRNSRR